MSHHDPKYAQELAVAVAAVRAASVVCRAVQKDLITAATIEKKDKSPVTVADFASQAVVCKTIRDAFATDTIVGEEDAAELRPPEAPEAPESSEAAPAETGDTLAKVTAQVSRVIDSATDAQVLDWIDLGTTGQGGATGRFWTLDPIDGTKGFLRGQQYAIALALIENGEVVLGVLGCPNLAPQEGAEPGLLMTAIKGQGAQVLTLEGDAVEGTPATVDGIAEASGAVICESVESGHTNQGQSSDIATKLGTSAEPYRIDSQCKYAAVAMGRASIYLRLPTRPGYQEKIWDHAAGVIVCQEAGGQVTDVEGKPLDFAQGHTLANNRGVVCTNGKLHDAVLPVVDAVLSH